MKKIAIFTIAMLLLLAASAQADLVALYHLDGNADDSSGNSNDGTEVGDATYTTGDGGMFNEALSVDGAGYVNCGDISTGDWENLTTEAWVWWDGTVVSGYAGVYFKAYGGSQDTGRLLINSGGAILIQNGNGNFFSAPGAVPSEQWCHVVYKYDQTAGMEYIYVDGVKEGEQSRSGDISGNGVDFWIGYGWWSSLYYPFSGLIDEVRIWDEALSEADILASASLAEIEVTKELLSPTLDPDSNGNGIDEVDMATEIEFTMEVTVNNDSDLTLGSVAIKDPLPAELELADTDPLTVTAGSASSSLSKGKSKKVFITWDSFAPDDFESGDEQSLTIVAHTKLNPGGGNKVHQEYTSPGVYELNGGAALSFYVTIAEEEICLVVNSDALMVEAMGEEEE